MHSEQSIVIRADAGTVYAIAADIERWPDRLPHYRYVRVLYRERDRRIAAMSARRNFIPVRWTAEQVLLPDVPRVTFRHVGGVTKGMDVEWRFEPVADGVRVSIRHELRLPWPLIGEAVARWIIGPVFIHNIAGKTLRQVKRLAETVSDLSRGAAVDATQGGD